MTKPPYEKGDLVRILMEEPLRHCDPHHPWARNGGFPPYQSFIVTDYYGDSKGFWNYRGPDGAGWGCCHLELIRPASTRIERILELAQKGN